MLFKKFEKKRKSKIWPRYFFAENSRVVFQRVKCCSERKIKFH